MEDFSTRTYGTSGLDNRPLFGETSAKVSADRDLRLRVCVCLSAFLSALPPGVRAGSFRAAPEGTCREKEPVLQSCFPLRTFCPARRLLVWDRVDQEES